MMRIRIAGVILTAVFVVSAVAAASASAEAWFVEKNAAFGTTPLSEKTKVTTKFTLGFKKGAVEISCTKLADVGGSITEGSTAAVKSLKFTGCKVVTPKKCNVESVPGAVKGTIETGEVAATLLAGPKVEFKPKTGINFTEFKLAGTGCGVVAGKFNVKGQATGTSTKPEEKEKLLTFSATSGSKLDVGEELSEFAGAVKLALSSKKNWGTE